MALKPQFHQQKWTFIISGANRDSYSGAVVVFKEQFLTMIKRPLGSGDS